MPGEKQEQKKKRERKKVAANAVWNLSFSGFAGEKGRAEEDGISSSGGEY